MESMEINNWSNIYDIQLEYEIILESVDDKQYSFIFNKEYDLTDIEIDGLSLNDENNYNQISDYDLILFDEILRRDYALHEDLLCLKYNESIELSKEELKRLFEENDFYNMDKLIKPLKLKAIWLGINI